MFAKFVVACYLMIHKSSEPDLNLQIRNDHGIYTTDEINKPSLTVRPQLSVIHLNIRSLNQHIQRLNCLLDSVPISFDLMGCSETRFQ